MTPPLSSIRSATEAVVLQPRTHTHLKRGIDQIVNAIRPTLGPLSRTVAINQIMTTNPPELLERGGVIARRIIELADSDADVGAMLIRGMICRLEDQAGDGTATAAVLFQSIYEQGVHYLTSGGSAMRLRKYLDAAVEPIFAELDNMTQPAATRSMLTAIAESACHDREMAEMLGEVFDLLGEYGEVDIRQGYRTRLEKEYIEGSYWEGGLFTRKAMTDHTQFRTEYENAAILITDFEIQEPREIVPIIDMALQAKTRRLVVVARSVSDLAMAGFLLANQRPEAFQMMVVKTPGTNPEDRNIAMQDLAFLTGGVPLPAVAGYSLRSVTPAHFGWADRAWASPTMFGVVNGKGDVAALRSHIESLQRYAENIEEVAGRRNVQERIGRLLGGSATVWIGGATESEIKLRKQLAEQTADILRAAMLSGVLPGGGIALLACRPALDQHLRDSVDPDERAAYRILLRALTEPTRVIVGNAGYNPEEILAEIRLSGGCGFDVMSGRMVDVMQADILDSAAVQKQVIHSAISTAALALTIDVLVHNKRPIQVSNPEG